MSEEIEDMALRLASPAELREMVQTLTRERDEADTSRRLAWGRLDRIRAALREAGVPSDDRSLDEMVAHVIRERDEAKAHWDLAKAQLLMVGSELCGDPKIDPADHRDPRHTPTLVEAARLRRERDEARAMLERIRTEPVVQELEQARADAARLRGLIESTAEGLDRITACGEAVRQGGPVPEDLDELSDGLHNAVTEAGGLVDEIRAALAGEGEAKRCAWTYDETHFAWDSSCGEKWILEDGGPNENEIRFCHGCGKPVKAVPYREEEEDTTTIPFCACGRRVSDCDGSRKGCGKTPEKAREA